MIRCFSLLLLVYIFSNNNVLGQSNDPFKPKLMQYTPASPNAAALGKFGEFPVDFSSGLVNVSIPLYEIKSSKLTLPITLSYHASGIKPIDKASCVGLGWALQAGGMISRSVRDKIDEWNGYLMSYNAIKPTTVLNPDYVLADYEYLKSFSRPGALYQLNDAEPDVFSYTLLNKSGQFFFGSDKVSTITIPYDNVKISYTISARAIVSITIVDTDGTTYIFGENGNTEDAFIDTGTGSQQSTNTGWMLTSIISADKSDTIQFSYTANTVQYVSGLTDQVEIWDNHGGNSVNNVYQFPSTSWGLHAQNSSMSNFDGTQRTLQQITFKNGKVVFEKDARQDGAMGDKINKMSVYSLDAVTNTYTKIKSVSFTYDYFDPTYNKRLRLNQLTLNTGSDASIQKYTFQYDNTSTQSPTTRAIDDWGYYNGHTSNTTLLKNEVINQASAGSYSGDVGISDRSPNFAAQACTLTSITFPTGGHTDFFYQVNKYSVPNMPDKNAGGLRIYQVKTYESANATPQVKTYVYGDNENGTGTIVTPIDYYSYYVTEYQLLYFYNFEASPRSPTESIRVRNFSSTPITGLTGMDGRIVYYTCVTEYDGTPAANNGKTIYKFDYSPDPYLYNIPTKGKFFRQNYSWKRGHLLEKTDYSSAGIPVQSTKNFYSQQKQQWYGNVGYVINENFHVTDNSFTSAPCANTCTNYQYAGMYSYNTFSVETGNFKLGRTEEYTYDQHDPTKYVMQETRYEYDPNIYEPSKITKYNSTTYDVVNYQYPLNYTTNFTSSDAFIQGIQYLKSVNNFIQPVEIYKQTYNADGSYIGTTDAVLTQFRPDLPFPAAMYKLDRTAPNAGFIPSSINGTNNSFVKDANYNKYIQFNSYQNGNILEQQKTNDTKNSYIWDYNATYPVAQTVGVGNAEIAYTSFESNGTGNWTGINPSKCFPMIAATGKKAYYDNSSNGFSITRSGLTAGKSYTVSYWTQNAIPYTFNVTTASASAARAIPGWNYFEHRITCPTDGTITINGQGAIDELRLYPQTGAQMTTYTYDPLVGITSQVDINNNITTYTYDGFGRLILVRDEDGNVLKKYCYNYNGQTSNSCTLWQNDDQQKQTFQKQGCASATSGTSVTYAVLPGTYISTVSQADANQQAQGDITANGQNYANQNGTCVVATPMVNVQGYNTAVANPSNSSFTYGSYDLQLTNESTQAIYHFTLVPKSTPSFDSLGQIPAGSYTVLFRPMGTPISVTCTYQFGSFSATNGTSGANSTGIPVSGATVSAIMHF